MKIYNNNKLKNKYIKLFIFIFTSEDVKYARNTPLHPYT